MRNTLLLMLAAFAALGLSAFTGCKKTETDPAESDSVKLGLFVSTTGGIADFGIATKNGVELAVKEINAAGGIGGKQIELISYDIASKPEEAGTAATKLATQDKVLVAMGAISSDLSLVAAPVFQRNGIPMVSPSSTNPTVTQQGDMIFRICYLDDFQGGALATFASKDLGAKRAAVLANQDDPYSTGLANFFKAKFEKLGGSIVADETYKKGTSDFNTQISNIKAQENVEVVFVPGYYNDVALIAKQLKAQGVNATILGGDGWESPKLTSLAEGALEGAYFGNHYSQDDPDEKVQNFVKAYKEAHNGEAPNSLAALGYDVVYVVKEAIEKGGMDRAKIAEALRGIKGYKGVTGKFDIDENRNAHKSITMLKIQGDKFSYVRQIAPDEVK